MDTATTTALDRPANSVTRAAFVGATAASCLTATAGRGPAAAAGGSALAESPPAARVIVYIGTYTPNADGIYRYSLHLESGILTRLGVTTGIKNPSWLALHPAKTFLYAVSEVNVIDGVKTGSVTAYAIAPNSGALTPLNTVSTQGAAPTYLSVHPSGRYAFAANYVGGSVTVLPIAADGRLGEPSAIVHGDGPHRPASATNDPPGNFATSDHSGSHMHMVAADPSGRFVIANDAGLDRTFIWHIDLERGRLIPAAQPVVEAPPGSAPRHFAFHPNGRVFYNLHEHDAMLATYRFDPHAGALSLIDRQSILPPGFAGSNLASEVVVSADGRFVYAANRLHDTIAIFATSDDGRLTKLGEQWVNADYPRSIAIDPSGGFLFSCNQHSDSITTFVRDERTGALTFSGRYEAVGTPVHMTFLAFA